MKRTNRDIYKKIRDIGNQFEEIPSLEEYLRSLWWIVSYSKDEKLSIEQFIKWLELAFTEKPPPFDREWVLRRTKANDDLDLVDYYDWEDTILYQIVDLRQMAAAGILDNEFRYYGVDAPRGSRWFNFDPLTYLECAIRGTFGGYIEEEVIVLVPSPTGESADSSIFEITDFSWGDFIWMLECGRCYE